MDELRSAAFYLAPKCTIPSRRRSIDKFLKMTATADRPLAVGLKHRNGEWLSIACGVYRPAAGMMLLQLNNDREFPRDSLSVVLRGYLIESLIHQGMKELIFLGRHSASLVSLRDANTYLGNLPRFACIRMAFGARIGFKVWALVALEAHPACTLDCPFFLREFNSKGRAI